MKTQAIISMILVALLVASCQTPTAMTNSHQRDRNSVAPTELDRDVLLAGIMKNQTVLASKLDSNIDKGLVVKNKRRTAERDTSGEVVQVGEAVLYGESDIELRLSTFHEVAANAGNFDLAIATQSQAQAGTNQVYATPGFDGLRLKVTALSNTSLNPENIKAPYVGRAAEKEATVGLLRAYWEGRTGYAATVIDKAGNAVTGIVKEVLKVTTPQGAALATAELLIESRDGKSVVVETTEKAK